MFGNMGVPSPPEGGCPPAPGISALKVESTLPGARLSVSGVCGLLIAAPLSAPNVGAPAGRLVGGRLVLGSPVDMVVLILIPCIWDVRFCIGLNAGPCEVPPVPVTCPREGKDLAGDPGVDVRDPRLTGNGDVIELVGCGACGAPTCGPKPPSPPRPMGSIEGGVAGLGKPCKLGPRPPLGAPTIALVGVGAP